MMIILRGFFALVLVAGLFSCTSEDANTQIEIYLPDSIRQTLQFDKTKLIVRITVNDAPAQTFEINDGLSSTNVFVSGIRMGQRNDIRIVWIEVVDGRNVELSQQRQSFIADERTLIDAPHSYSQYDYDNDSISNFDERLADTCVWSANEQCGDDDIPPVTAGSLLVDEDFSDGRAAWYFEGVDAYFRDGEFCVTSPSSAIQYWESYINNSMLFPVEANKNYVFSFDIKADVPSTVRYVANNLEDGIYTAVVNQVIPVSTSYERKVVPFSFVGDWPSVEVGFALGNGQRIRYCIDNVRLSVAG